MGFSPSFKMPNFARGGLTFPGLGRASMQYQNYSPGLKGMGGGLPNWALPSSLRGSLGGSMRLPSFVPRYRDCRRFRDVFHEP